MYNPPNQTTAAAPHRVLGMWCAWVSVFMPLVAGVFFEFSQPTWIAAPAVVYWATFVGSVIGFALGCVAVRTIGRRVDWMVLTPAILGIALSLVLCYCALAFGILASTGPIPQWDQIFPWQGAPAGRNW